jgi:hypothetical protein
MVEFKEGKVYTVFLASGKEIMGRFYSDEGMRLQLKAVLGIYTIIKDEIVAWIEYEKDPYAASELRKQKKMSREEKNGLSDD